MNNIIIKELKFQRELHEVNDGFFILDYLPTGINIITIVYESADNIKLVDVLKTTIDKLERI